MRESNREESLKNISDAASKLADDRFLLKEEVKALVRRGAEECGFVTK